VRSQAKRRRAGVRQAAAGGRRQAWRLRWAAARRVCMRRSQRGRLSGGWVSWGQVAQEERRRGSWWPGKMPAMSGGWRCRETEKGKQEEEDEDLFINFAKVQGVHCKVKFSSKL
jgi:hypothetical protein